MFDAKTDAHDDRALLEHLRDEWGTAGVIAEALAPVPPDQVESVLRAARSNAGDGQDRSPSPADGWTEPGRSVNDSGRVVYAWPPAGRFADLWRRFEAAGFSDQEKHELLSLLRRWQGDNSTLIAFTDEAGEWVDVEPD